MYVLAFLVPQFLCSLGTFGLELANIYLGGSKRAGWTELASNSLLVAVLIGGVLAAGTMIYFLACAPPFLAGVETRCLLVAVLTLPFSLVTVYFKGIVLAQRRIAEYNVMQLLPICTWLAVIVVVLFAFHGGVFGVVLASAGTTALGGLGWFILVKRTTRITLSLNALTLKESLRFGLQSYIGDVFQKMNYRVDMFIVASLMDVTSVGYYSAAVALAETLWYFPATVGTLVLARTPGLAVGEANDQTPVICRNTLFITLLAALALLAGSRLVIWLFYGAAFLPALHALWILLPGVVAISLWKVLGNEMAGRGKPVWNTVVAAISVAVNIPMNLWLIPRMGISGAALASTVSYSVCGAAMLVAFVRTSGNSWLATVLVKPEDIRIYYGILCSTTRLLRDRRRLAQP